MFTNIRNAARAATAALRGVKSGRVVERSERGYEVADLLTGDLTPARLAPVLRNAVYGDWEQQFALFDRLLETDGHLRSVSGTRKMALTGLEWELVPASEFGRHAKLNDAAAAAAHEYCAELLADMTGFRAALKGMAEAIARGIKVIEIEYRGGVPIACHPIEDCQLRGDAMNPARVRIAMENNWTGIAVDEYPPGKFIVHAPEPIGALAIRGGLLRAAVLPLVAKRFSVHSWVIFNELYGQPIAIAKYGAEGDATVRNELTKLFKTLGQNRGGVFPQGCDVQLLEAAARGQLPQERFAKYVDAEISKLFLGQTLTTEIGETGGAKAAASVHDEVRRDLLAKDIEDESEAIREQLLIPLVRAKFGEDAARIAPYFRRVVEEAKDLLATANLVDTVVNRLGAKVPKSFVEDELGVRLVEGEERDEPLPGAPSGGGFESGFGGGFSFSPNAERTALVANRTLMKIVKRRRSPAAKLSAWIFAAVLASTAHTANVIGAVQAFVEKRRDLPEVLHELPEVWSALPIDEMQALQEHYLLAARMAGMAQARELAVTRRRVTASANSARLIAHAEIDFARIPFVAAIESLRDRLGLDPDTFIQLEAEARSRAWRVAGVADMSLLATIHQALVRAVADGETSRDFRLRLPAMAAAAGWSGENPWHADLVHYQNFVMAHAAGRHGEYREFGVRQWRFVSNGDSCPICEPLVGKVFALDDTRYAPPVHFWCDCVDEPVFEGEAGAGEMIDSGSVSNPALDEARERDSGFKWNPAQYANLEPVRLDSFPEELRPVFAQFATARGWEVAV